MDRLTQLFRDLRYRLGLGPRGHKCGVCGKRGDYA